MNRLVLIGNGFDLAHGMKTGYNDYLLWYLKKCFTSAERTRNYDDKLISIHFQHTNLYGSGYYGKPGIVELIDWLYANGTLHGFLSGEFRLKEEDGFAIVPVQAETHSFLMKLIQNCSISTWVEIENIFYEELKQILVAEDATGQSEKLDELNNCFSVLIDNLHEYLSTIPTNVVIEDYLKILLEPIRAKDLLIGLDKDIEPENIHVLNFNYTATTDSFSDPKHHSKTKVPIEVNHIHGRLNDKLNPIVFGFGDELDEDYQKMEKSRSKGFFRFIKSFWYFRTQNYHNLMRFIESDDYQITILGHSCGLSDRTMLNMIFEHPNCKSIKIYYYGDQQNNNFTSITEEISRHFKNKAQMRNKIVPLPRSRRMPQYDDKIGLANDTVIA